MISSHAQPNQTSRGASFAGRVWELSGCYTWCMLGAVGMLMGAAWSASAWGKPLSDIADMHLFFLLFCWNVLIASGTGVRALQRVSQHGWPISWGTVSVWMGLGVGVLIGLAAQWVDAQAPTVLGRVVHILSPEAPEGVQMMQAWPLWWWAGARWVLWQAWVRAERDGVTSWWRVYGPVMGGLCVAFGIWKLAWAPHGPAWFGLSGGLGSLQMWWPVLWSVWLLGSGPGLTWSFLNGGQLTDSQQGRSIPLRRHRVLKGLGFSVSLLAMALFIFEDAGTLVLVGITLACMVLWAMCAARIIRRFQARWGGNGWQASSEKQDVAL